MRQGYITSIRAGSLRCLLTALLFSLLTFSYKPGYAINDQNSITLNLQNVSLDKVFKEIEKQTSYSFLYMEAVLKNSKPVDVKVANASIEKVMEVCFKEQEGLTWKVMDKVVVVKVMNHRGDQDSARPIDVKGRVMSEEGKPLVGATVKIRGTNKVTTTDGDGWFILNNVGGDEVLEVSYVEHEPKTINIKFQDKLVVRLSSKQAMLDEAIVIAYGTTTTRFNTGNIASVKEKDIEKQPVNNPLLTLQGRVPGVFINQNTGVPGGGITVRIQGQNSIGNGNDPLYVVDGVPYVSQMLSTTTGGASPGILNNSGGPVGSGAGNPLSFLNPSDIESIEILKDADATAIFGSRAANGAILITTKKGKVGKTKVGIEAQMGWGRVTRKMDLLNTRQYLDMRYEAIRNDGQEISSGSNHDLRVWDTTQYTDWQNELIGGTSQYSNYNAYVSGGSASTQYLVSGTFRKETTVFPGAFDDQKGSIHFNLNNLSNSEKLHIRLSGSYLMDRNKLPSIDLTSEALTLPPNAPELFKPDGSLNWAPNGSGISTWDNPLSSTVREYENKTTNIISNLMIGYFISPGLELKTNLGYTNLQTDEFSSSPMTGIRPEYRPFFLRGALFGNSSISSWIVEPQISFQRMVAKGTLNILVGNTFQQLNGEGYNLTTTGYNSDAVLKDIRSASSIMVTSSAASIYKYTAIFSRINYNFKDKYILNFTGRRDGSSRFGTENRFHNFASIGAAWIFSEERLFKGLPFVKFGKLRGSYGTTGNDQISDYRYFNLYNPISVGVPYQGATGLVPDGIPNPYLQWEQTKKLQFGIDLGILNNRFFITANYVRNRSSNQLLNYSLPVITGNNSIIMNFPATVQNTALEVQLSTVNAKSNEFKWTSSFNFSIPRNKLIQFPNIESSTYASSLVIGQPVGINKVFRYLGVDTATGIYQFADQHGSPTLYPDPLTDNKSLINTFPTFYGGLENSITYGGVELSILIQFVKQIGSEFSFYGAGNLPPGYRQINQPVTVLSRWRNPGDIATVQRFNSDLSLYQNYLNLASSDAAFSSNASFIRLKNVSLSYQLPEQFLERLKMQSCQIYMHGQNILTLTKYRGLDPETGSFSLPPLVMFAAGLKVGL